MTLIVTPIAVLVDMVISCAALWLAGQITTLKIEFKQAAIVCVVFGMMWFLPYAGGILSLIVFYYLTKQYTDAPTWPDMILLVVITKAISAMCWYSL